MAESQAPPTAATVQDSPATPPSPVARARQDMDGVGVAAHLVCGAAARSTAALMLMPLDVVKTRMQFAAPGVELVGVPASAQNSFRACVSRPLFSERAGGAVLLRATDATNRPILGGLGVKFKLVPSAVFVAASWAPMRLCRLLRSTMAQASRGGIPALYCCWASGFQRLSDS